MFDDVTPTFFQILLPLSVILAQLSSAAFVPAKCLKPHEKYDWKCLEAGALLILQWYGPKNLK